MKIFLIIILTINVFCSKNNSNSENNLRKLDSTFTYYFINASHLYFDSFEKQWKFNIYYYYITNEDPELEEDEEYPISILYKGNLALAYCKDDYYPNLNCYLKQNGQTNLDTVQLSNDYTNHPKIKWQNLTSTYVVPIDCSLKYKDSYNLTTSKSGNNKIRVTFIIEIEKESELPDNAMVIVDIHFNGNNQTAICYHKNLLLNCSFTENHRHDCRCRILPEKKSGTVTWLNLDKNINYFVPVVLSIRIISSYNLQLINNKWNFKLKGYYYHTMGSIVDYVGLYTINVKIVKSNGNTLIYLAKCFNNSTSPTYNCIVEGENQEVLDLVYLTNTGFCNASSSFETGSTLAFTDKLIIRNATLSFIKAYDFIDYKTPLKILVGDDENIPDNATVQWDFLYQGYSSIYLFNDLCEYYDHVLYCKFHDESSSTSHCQTYKILSQINQGSITWTNLIHKFVDIPKNHTFNFKSAQDLVFMNNKWNFRFSATNSGNKIPKTLIVIIDIVHNSHYETAKCESLKYAYENDMAQFYCISNYESQTINDTIKMRRNRKYGTVTWKNDILSTDVIIKPIEENKTTNFEFKDAYELYYTDENKWTFALNIYPATSGTYGGKFIIDIIVIKANNEKKEETASCFFLGKIDTYIGRAICTAEYDQQEDTDLIQMNPNKSTKSTINWTKGLTNNYPITLKTSLFAIRKYDVQNIRKDSSTRFWIFRIEVTDGILPTGSKVSISIDKISKELKCTSESNTVIFCNHTCSGTSGVNIEEPNLVFIKSPESNITWLNKDLNTSLSTELISADKLYYDETEKKWNFILTQKIYFNKDLRLYVDVLYGDELTRAKCQGIENKLSCVVDKSNQDRKKIIKLSKTKFKYTSITWTNLDEDKGIPMYTYLTYDKPGRIKLVDNIWKFNIYAQDELSDDSSVRIDINVNYTVTPNIYDYNLTYDATADCIYKNKELNCQYTSDKDTKYESIEIYTEQKEGTSSTVLGWNNANNGIFLYLEGNYKYGYASKIFENRYREKVFNITVLDTIPKYSNCIIDIKIGTSADICYCVAEDISILQCKIDDAKYTTTAEIVVSKTKSSQSSITWTNLNEDQILKAISSEYLYSYYYQSTETNYPYLDINILVNGGEFKSNLILPVKICKQKDKKVNINNYQEILEYIPCNYNYGILFCTITDLNKEKDEIFIIGEESGIILDWIEPGNYTYDSTINYVFNFNKLLYCYFDEINKYYIYSLKNAASFNKAQKFVMDIFINGVNSYAICTNKINRDNIECHTASMEKRDDHEIKIQNGRIYSNTELANFPDDYIIYPNDIVFLAISKIYDLKFVSSVWEFKIKPLNDIHLTIEKAVDILIDGATNTANCKDDTSGNFIYCKVNSVSQTNTQLIKLNSQNSDDNIYIANLENYGIPLLSELELIEGTDMKYDEGWSFVLKVKNNKADFNIPIGSTFSIDIKYNTDKEDLAICTETGSTRSNNEINLLCEPTSTIKKSELIILKNTAKSNYASVKFTPTISDDDIYIYLTLDLYVEYVTMIEYDDIIKRWYFNMIVKDADIPLNSRIKVDIKYNSINEVAICILNEKNNFQCTPLITTQNKNDNIVILQNKQKGTVNLTPPENLNFLYILNCVKVYNLKFESKWSFSISLKESKTKNGITTKLDILIDDENDTADCEYNDNVLNCEINSANQDKFNVIRIKEEQTHDTNKIKWNNLDKITDLYLQYEIKFLNVIGGFYEGKWKFNIYYQDLDTSKKRYNNKVLLDTLFNDKQSTAICEITFSNYLKCTLNEEIQTESDKIKLDLNQSPAGTINFQTGTTSSEIQVKPVNISINYISSIGCVNENGYVEFIIEGTLKKALTYDLEEDTVTMVEIKKYKLFGYSNYKVSCLTNNVKKSIGSYIYMICTTQLKYDNKFAIKIDSNGNSNYVKFSVYKDIEILFTNTD